MAVVPKKRSIGQSEPDMREAGDQRRLLGLSWFALTLSIVGSLFAVVTIAVLLSESRHPAHLPHFLAFALPCLGFALGGMVLGVGTRRFPCGRTAVAVAALLVAVVSICLQKGAAL